jgi:hypothetical protein
LETYRLSAASKEESGQSETSMILPAAPHELKQIKRLQLIQRKDWPAAFSAIPDSVWPQTHWGWTPFESRLQVRGRLKLLDAIADYYLEQRPGGGRFFIDGTWAYYKDELAHLNLPPVVTFKLLC